MAVKLLIYLCGWWTSLFSAQAGVLSTVRIASGFEISVARKICCSRARGGRSHSPQLVDREVLSRCHLCRFSTYVALKSTLAGSEIRGQLWRRNHHPETPPVAMRTGRGSRPGCRGLVPGYCLVAYPPRAGMLFPLQPEVPPH
ncbi:hypothetical protein FN846DRAFT_652127 [Sphaerosporella brunnea]|uniref:Secreted protein n=1 Tax=Sphaerosporella brunnea TaxID=1250544 RepID=A0A5J5EBN5_9PEZI|nr:hypothetical protein FN846DRAFT_652127 [Sphaerosporella brunnea]